MSVIVIDAGNDHSWVAFQGSQILMEDVVPSLIEFYDPGKDTVESVESES